MVNRRENRFSPPKFHIGDGYDVSTGIFTTPFDGVYLSTCFLASHTDEFKADLVVPAAIATSGSHGNFGAAGNALPIALVTGERVSIHYVAGSVFLDLFVCSLFNIFRISNSMKHQKLIIRTN